jgi:hypothetical protein
MDYIDNLTDPAISEEMEEFGDYYFRNTTFLAFLVVLGDFEDDYHDKIRFLKLLEDLEV